MADNQPLAAVRATPHHEVTAPGLQRGASYQQVVEGQQRLALDGSDAALERALVHLRLAAAAELTAAPGRDRWPPELADPFPEVTDRLPEIDRDRLDVGTVGGALVHHGAVVVRGLLRGDDLVRLRHGLDRTHDERAEVVAEVLRATAAGEPLPVHDPHQPGGEWFAPFRPGQRTAGEKGKPHLIRVVDAPRVLADLLTTYERLGLLDLVAAYLGEPPVFTANKTVLRYARTTAMMPTDFHQDGRFMGDDVRALNIWVTLDDCGRDAPSLDVVPRREPCIHPTGNGANGFDWTLSEQEVRALAAPTGITRLELSAGDAVLFDQYLVHRSGHAPNMQGLRRAVEWWFYAPSHLPASYQPLRA